LLILEVRGVVVDIGGESVLLLILEVSGVVVHIGGERGLLMLLLILEVRVGCC
jgi:hypothetical protein